MPDMFPQKSTSPRRIHNKKNLKSTLKIIIILLFILLNIFSTDEVSGEGDSHIIIDYNKEIGPINNMVFGNNFAGFEDGKKKHTHSNYGTGLWDPLNNKPVNELMDLARSAGISIVRFTTLNDYSWKKAIGKNRENFLYGIDEFMRTVNEIRAEPVFTISYFIDSEQDASDLVEYLNAPHDGSNPKGGIDWADIRAKNGHPEPYNVRYFEFGNEVFGFWSKRHDYKVTPQEYAIRYLSYREAMKGIDKSVQLGLSLHHYDIEWDKIVLKGVGKKVDYVIKHIYPPKDLAYYKSTEHYDTKDLYKVILGSLNVYTENQLTSTQNLIKNITNKDDVLIAVTEYNIGLNQHTPLYRHMCGSALVNAELLRILMNPGHKVLMANYWHFANDFWGMVKSEDNFMSHDYRIPIKYIRRPNYYVYELYNKHFGDMLIDIEVQSAAYDMSGYNYYNKALSRRIGVNVSDNVKNEMRIPYLSVNASKGDGGKKIYLMTVNKNIDEKITSLINLKGVKPAKIGKAWILECPTIDATNEAVGDYVNVVYKEFGITNNSFKFTFEPRSLTSIEIVVDSVK